MGEATPPALIQGPLCMILPSLPATIVVFVGELGERNWGRRRQGVNVLTATSYPA